MTLAKSPIRLRKLRPLVLLVLCAVSASAQSSNAWPRPPKFRVVALAERGDDAWRGQLSHAPAVPSAAARITPPIRRAGRFTPMPRL